MPALTSFLTDHFFNDRQRTKLYASFPAIWNECRSFKTNIRYYSESPDWHEYVHISKDTWQHITGSPENWRSGLPIGGADCANTLNTLNMAIIQHGDDIL